MITQSSYGKILEISESIGAGEGVIPPRIMRTVEELGNLVKIGRKYPDNLMRLHRACAEVFICAVVNALCVSQLSLPEINSRLANVRSNPDGANFDVIQAVMASTVGKMASELCEEITPAEFAFYSLSLADSCYRAMLRLARDTNGDYLNSQVEAIYMMWSAKSKVVQIEQSGAGINILSGVPV